MTKLQRIYILVLQSSPASLRHYLVWAKETIGKGIIIADDYYDYDEQYWRLVYSANENLLIKKSDVVITS